MKDLRVGRANAPFPNKTGLAAKTVRAREKKRSRFTRRRPEANASITGRGRLPMSFDTPLTLSGPLRRPQQMLADQEYAGHTSIHDDAMAEKLGFRAGPIEGPT